MRLRPCPPRPPATSHRDPAALSASRAALAKQQQQQQNGLKSSAGEAKRSWLSKLTKNKAAALEQIGDKLARGQYLAPMDQESVGERVENSLGQNLEQFGSFQGALRHIIQTGGGRGRRGCRRGGAGGGQMGGRGVENGGSAASRDR